jgi:hypothetical protein
MRQRPQQSREYKTGNKMLDQLYMQSLADAMKMPEEVMPAGKVTVSAPEPEMAGMDKAFVGTRLNVPKPGQPTPQDREKMAVGLLDTLAGALRGAAAQTMGLPGDIRSILDMINQEGAEKYLGQRSFATTEEILKDTSVRVPGTQIDVPFPPVLKEGVPNRAERQGAVEVAQEVGTFLPAPGVPEAAIQGVKAVGKAIKATKNMPVGMSIQDVSESMQAANAWANPKMYFAQIEDATQKQNMAQIDKNMRQYAEQGMPLSKIKKELERDIGLKLSTDQIDYVSGFVKSKNKADKVIPKAPKIESKAFKSWFGESKVVNKDGAPQVMYHGTPEDIQAFLPNQFFANSPEDANTYAFKNVLRNDQVPNEELDDIKGANLIPVYISAKKIATPDDVMELVKKMGYYNDRELDSFLYTSAYDEVYESRAKKVIAELKKQGFDAIRHNDFDLRGESINSLQVFEPKQVKSVFNKGEFDPKNPNLLLGVGGAGAAATQEENK